ncbi:MAG TPA: gamma-glutamyltransferase, partial [Pantoea agglomerans]|nr:gamma-glutamyltransferase [Pantoea agglomerans]
MIQSNMAPQGMAVTPHHLASESALAVLRDGGNAIEAMVAAAATIAVVYPHMNGLGGDGFWLILPPGGDPVAIDASGAAGSLAHHDFYADHPKIPHRGPKAALTVAGTVSGWQEALNLSADMGTPQLPLERLLREVIRNAADGIPVTTSQSTATAECRSELQHQPGVSATFMTECNVPHAGSRPTT